MTKPDKAPPIEDPVAKHHKVASAKPFTISMRFTEEGTLPVLFAYWEEWMVFARYKTIADRAKAFAVLTSRKTRGLSPRWEYRIDE